MNYKKLHDAIIARSLRTTPIGYSEKHHIVPKCMNGTNDPTNIVRLPARDHFIVHRLLCKIYPENTKLRYAYEWMFSSPPRSRRAKDVGWSKSISKSHVYAYRKNNLRLTEEHKARISAGLVGHKHSPKTIAKVKLAVRDEAFKEALRKAHSRNWIVTLPTNESVSVTNLYNFCKLHNLHSGAMSRVAAGKQSHHKGYIVAPSSSGSISSK